MNHIFNLLFITLLLVNLAGLAAGGAKLTDLPYGLAKAFTVLTGCLIFFFVEHYHGFRTLTWLMPLATGASLWLLWKQRARWREFVGGETAFLFGFGYAMMWRYFYPNIDASSEKIADLSFVASYLQGGTLPVPDLWLHPYKLTQYYSFQHYAAALMGRILQLPAGTAYNIGYGVVVGLVMAPAYEYVRSFTRSRSSQAIVLAALLMGGTGACLFTPFLVKNETLFSSMRFIGAASADDDAELLPAGIALRKATYGPEPLNHEKREKIVEMPMEIFAYVVQLGDFHAPLAGYVLLTTAVAAFGVLLKNPQQKWALGTLLGTIPLSIAANTWSFPLQSIFVGLAFCFIWKYRARPDWRVVLGASLCAWLLLYPYFSYFLSRTIGAGMSIKMVQPDPWTLLTYYFAKIRGADMSHRLLPFNQHAPLLSYLIQLWPVYSLVILGWFAPDAKHKEYRWFSIWIIGFLILMETVNIDDLYGGRFDRFNTTLKWWPWVAALATLLLAPMNFAAVRGRSVIRIGTAAVLFGTLWFLVGSHQTEGGSGILASWKLWVGMAFLAAALLALVQLTPIGKRSYFQTGAFLILLVIIWFSRGPLGLKGNYNGLVGSWLRGDKYAKGQLDGAAYMRAERRDPNAPQNVNAQQSIMNYLEANPGGVLLECPKSDQQAFIVTGALPLFTNHPTVFGWASHEQLWRGYQKDIEQRWNRTKEFFRGELERPLEYLAANDVRFIIWPGTENVDQALFDKISAQVSEKYHFVRFDEVNPKHGIFVLK